MDQTLSPLAAATAALAQIPPTPPAEEPAPPAAAPAAGEGAEAPPAASDGGHAPPTTPEGEAESAAAPEGEGEAEGEGEVEGERAPEAGEPAAEQVIAIPGRFPNQSIELVLDSPEARESVQRLVNGYMRGEQAREVTERAKAELARASEERLAFVADPVAVLERASVDVRAMVLRNLLLDEGVRGAVADDLAVLATEGVVGLEDRATRQRLEMKESARGQIAQIREREKFAASLDQMLVDTLDRTSMSDEGKDAAYDLLLTALEAHETRSGRPLRSLEEVRSVLAPHATALHLSFDAPPAASPAPAAGAPPHAARPVPGAPAPARSVASLKSGQAARAASSATASAGRGAPPIPPAAPLNAPKGAMLREATAHLRQMQGKPTS